MVRQRKPTWRKKEGEESASRRRSTKKNDPPKRKKKDEDDSTLSGASEDDDEEETMNDESSDDDKEDSTAKMEATAKSTDDAKKTNKGVTKPRAQGTRRSTRRKSNDHAVESEIEAASSHSDSDDDMPLKKLVAKKNKARASKEKDEKRKALKKTAANKRKPRNMRGESGDDSTIVESDNDADDDESLLKLSKRIANKKRKSRRVGKTHDSEDDSAKGESENEDGDDTSIRSLERNVIRKRKSRQGKKESESGDDSTKIESEHEDGDDTSIRFLKRNVIRKRKSRQGKKESESGDDSTKIDSENEDEDDASIRSLKRNATRKRKSRKGKKESESEDDSKVESENEDVDDTSIRSLKRNATKKRKARKGKKESESEDGSKVESENETNEESSVKSGKKDGSIKRKAGKLKEDNEIGDDHAKDEGENGSTTSTKRRKARNVDSESEDSGLKAESEDQASLVATPRIGNRKRKASQNKDDFDTTTVGSKALKEAEEDGLISRKVAAGLADGQREHRVNNKDSDNYTCTEERDSGRTASQKPSTSIASKNHIVESVEKASESGRADSNKRNESGEHGDVTLCTANIILPKDATEAVRKETSRSGSDCATEESKGAAETKSAATKSKRPSSTEFVATVVGSVKDVASSIAAPKRGSVAKPTETVIESRSAEPTLGVLEDRVSLPIAASFSPAGHEAQSKLAGEGNSKDSETVPRNEEQPVEHPTGSTNKIASVDLSSPVISLRNTKLNMGLIEKVLDVSTGNIRGAEPVDKIQQSFRKQHDDTELGKSEDLAHLSPDPKVQQRPELETGKSLDEAHLSTKPKAQQLSVSNNKKDESKTKQDPTPDDSSKDNVLPTILAKEKIPNTDDDVNKQASVSNEFSTSTVRKDSKEDTNGEQVKERTTTIKSDRRTTGEVEVAQTSRDQVEANTSLKSEQVSSMRTTATVKSVDLNTELECYVSSAKVLNEAQEARLSTVEPHTRVESTEVAEDVSAVKSETTTTHGMRSKGDTVHTLSTSKDQAEQKKPINDALSRTRDPESGAVATPNQIRIPQEYSSEVVEEQESQLNRQPQEKIAIPTVGNTVGVDTAELDELQCQETVDEKGKRSVVGADGPDNTTNSTVPKADADIDAVSLPKIGHSVSSTSQIATYENSATEKAVEDSIGETTGEPRDARVEELVHTPPTRDRDSAIADEIRTGSCDPRETEVGAVTTKEKDNENVVVTQSQDTVTDTIPSPGPFRASTDMSAETREAPLAVSIEYKDKQGQVASSAGSETLPVSKDHDYTRQVGSGTDEGVDIVASGKQKSSIDHGDISSNRDGISNDVSKSSDPNVPTTDLPDTSSGLSEVSTQDAATMETSLPAVPSSENDSKTDAIFKNPKSADPSKQHTVRKKGLPDGTVIVHQQRSPVADRQRLDQRSGTTVDATMTGMSSSSVELPTTENLASMTDQNSTCNNSENGISEDDRSDKPQVMSIEKVGIKIEVTQELGETTGFAPKKHTRDSYQSWQSPYVEIVHRTDKVEKEKSRLSLELIKLRLYSVGKRVHGTLGFEHVFGKYWNAISHRLETNLDSKEAPKVRAALDSYLKTKTLRKLHNKLILGLLGRILKPKVPLQDILQHIPAHLRDRVSVSKQCRDRKEITPSLPHELETSSEKGYRPDVIETQPNAVHCVKPDANSQRIPGSIHIDPFVRHLAESTGMRATDGAVWLLVIAAREYSKLVLASSVSSIKALSNGKIPPLPPTRPQLVLSNRQIEPRTENTSVQSEKNSNPEIKKCITAFDVHAVASSIPVGARSLSGCLSRVAFERSLFSSCENGGPTQNRAFDDLKSFILSSVAPPISKQQIPVAPVIEIDTSKRDPNKTNESKSKTIVDRKSPPMRGLGRGAKDLKSLMQRATSFNSGRPAKPEEKKSASAAQSKPNTGQTTPPTQSVSTSAVTGERSAQTTNQEETASTSEQDQAGVPRRGKGFGVKNLAAMRARSVTIKPEDVAKRSSSEAAKNSVLAAAAIVAESFQGSDDDEATAPMDSESAKGSTFAVPSQKTDVDAGQSKSNIAGEPESIDLDIKKESTATVAQSKDFSATETVYRVTKNNLEGSEAAKLTAIDSNSTKVATPAQIGEILADAKAPIQPKSVDASVPHQGMNLEQSATCLSDLVKTGKCESTGKLADTPVLGYPSKDASTKDQTIKASTSLLASKPSHIEVIVDAESRALENCTKRADTILEKADYNIRLESSDRTAASGIAFDTAQTEKTTEGSGGSTTKENAQDSEQSNASTTSDVAKQQGGPKGSIAVLQATEDHVATGPTSHEKDVAQELAVKYKDASDHSKNELTIVSRLKNIFSFSATDPPTSTPAAREAVVAPEVRNNVTLDVASGDSPIAKSVANCDTTNRETDPTESNVNGNYAAGGNGNPDVPIEHKSRPPPVTTRSPSTIDAASKDSPGADTVAIVDGPANPTTKTPTAPSNDTFASGEITTRDVGVSEELSTPTAATAIVANTTNAAIAKDSTTDTATNMDTAVDSKPEPFTTTPTSITAPPTTPKASPSEEPAIDASVTVPDTTAAPTLTTAALERSTATPVVPSATVPAATTADTEAPALEDLEAGPPSETKK